MQKGKKLQAGATLIEALSALSILAAVMVGAAKLTDSYINDTKAVTAAHQLRSIGEAAKGYIAANRANILARATETQPCLIRASDLTTYLPGVTGVNSYGQTLSVLVTEPSPNVLSPLVVATGGTAPGDADLAMIANALGGSGGGVYKGAVNTVQGVGNGWSINLAAAPGSAYKAAPVLCATGTGSAALPVAAEGVSAMALWSADESVGSSFLYREAVAGRPELNTMNTPLIMGAVNALDDNCATIGVGAISRDAQGKVLSCDGSKWKSQGSAYWEDPVDARASLPACNAASAFQTRIVKEPAVGSGPRAYTCDGASWQALAVDDNGDFSVAQDLSVARNFTVAGNTVLGDAATDTVTINAKTTALGGLTVGDGGLATADNTLVINRTATENQPCSPDGAVARDANGLILSCQSGRWKKATGDTGAIGGYIFKITGYASPLFYGVGKVVSGQFYGDLICDPQTVNANCSYHGRFWCGSSASCAWVNAYNTHRGTIGAAALPINTITKKW